MFDCCRPGQIERIDIRYAGQGNDPIRTNQPNAAPNVEELKSKAVDAVSGEIGKPDAISGLPESVLNPFFDALRRLGFIPVLGLPGGPLRPGDIVDTSTGYTVVARQETAFPTLQVRTYPTTLPQFDLVDAKGRPVLHIACDNATRSDVSQGELRQHLYRDQELLLTHDTQVVAGVISCGTFKVTQEVRPLDIRGTIGTGRNDVQIAARLATPRLFRAPPSS